MKNQGHRRRTYSMTEWENEDGYMKPVATVRPEQEDVVFLRQMLEACGALPADEATLMYLIFDRASLSEMAAETGLTSDELMSRLRSGQKRLLAAP